MNLLFALFRRIDEQAEDISLPGGERPALADRFRMRRRATGAAMAYCKACEDSGAEPAEEGVRMAVENEFRGDTLDEPQGLWLSLLVPVIIRLVLEWWIARRRKEGGLVNGSH